MQVARNLIKFEVNLQDQYMGTGTEFPPPKSGTSGVWWHEEERGPLKNLPFISQFGSMKFTKVNLDENMKPHFNDGIEIHYVESGKYDWEFEGKTVELLPDDLSVTAPWHLNGSPAGKMDLGRISWIILKPLNFSPEKPLNLGKWTQLSKSFQSNLGQLISGQKGIVLRKARVFKKYVTELRKELTRQEKGYGTVVANLMENFLIELHRELEGRRLKIESQDSFISKLGQTVSGDFSNKWKVEELALRFGMGKTKFTDEVKRLTGYPPNSYIINLKISKARELLEKDSGTTLSEIAYRCGFSSLQHFTSSFTQRTGISPGKYRQGR